jgi:hypothetical protein
VECFLCVCARGNVISFAYRLFENWQTLIIYRHRKHSQSIKIGRLLYALNHLAWPMSITNSVTTCIFCSFARTRRQWSSIRLLQMHSAYGVCHRENSSFPKFTISLTIYNLLEQLTFSQWVLALWVHWVGRPCCLALEPGARDNNKVNRRATCLPTTQTHLFGSRNLTTRDQYLIHFKMYTTVSYVCSVKHLLPRKNPSTTFQDINVHVHVDVAASTQNTHNLHPGLT